MSLGSRNKLVVSPAGASQIHSGYLHLLTSISMFVLVTSGVDASTVKFGTFFIRNILITYCILMTLYCRVVMVHCTIWIWWFQTECLWFSSVHISRLTSGLKIIMKVVHLSICKNSIQINLKHWMPWFMYHFCCKESFAKITSSFSKVEALLRTTI